MQLLGPPHSREACSSHHMMLPCPQASAFQHSHAHYYSSHHMADSINRHNVSSHSRRVCCIRWPWRACKGIWHTQLARKLTPLTILVLPCLAGGSSVIEPHTYSIIRVMHKWSLHIAVFLLTSDAVYTDAFKPSFQNLQWLQAPMWVSQLWAAWYSTRLLIK